jgi:uncharacterized membrane protein
MLPLVVLALVIGVPVGWFISEFQSPRWVRLLLGCLSISLCFGVAFLAGCLTELGAFAHLPLAMVNAQLLWNVLLGREGPIRMTPCLWALATSFEFSYRRV